MPSYTIIKAGAYRIVAYPDGPLAVSIIAEYPDGRVAPIAHWSATQAAKHAEEEPSRTATIVQRVDLRAGTTIFTEPELARLVVHHRPDLSVEYDSYTDPHDDAPGLPQLVRRR